MRRTVVASMAAHAVAIAIVARAPVRVGAAAATLRSTEPVDVEVIAPDAPAVSEEAATKAQSETESTSVNEGEARAAEGNASRDEAGAIARRAPTPAEIIHEGLFPSGHGPSFADMIQAQIATMDPNGFGHVNPSLLGRDRGVAILGALAGGGAGLAHPELFPSVRIPDDVIARVVRANAGRVRTCIASAMFRDPSMHGEVRVAFTIGPAGAVTEAHDDGGSIDDETTRACVVRAFGGMTFGPPPGGKAQSVRFPVRF